MTKLLIPPLMFRGNAQAMGWARAVADQGRDIQEWDPALSAFGGGTINTVVTNIASYNFIGGSVTLSIEITFNAATNVNALQILLPLSGVAYPVAAPRVGGIFLDDGSTYYDLFTLMSPTGMFCSLIDPATASIGVINVGTYTLSGTTTYLTTGLKSGTIS